MSRGGSEPAGLRGLRKQVAEGKDEPLELRGGGSTETCLKAEGTGSSRERAHALKYFCFLLAFCIFRI